MATAPDERCPPCRRRSRRRCLPKYRSVVEVDIGEHGDVMSMDVVESQVSAHTHFMTATIDALIRKNEGSAWRPSGVQNG